MCMWGPGVFRLSLCLSGKQVEVAGVGAGWSEGRDLQRWSEWWPVSAQNCTKRFQGSYGPTLELYFRNGGEEGYIDRVET